MIYLCAQPAIDYYAWQLEVMIQNFMENKINPNDVHIVCSYRNKEIPESFQRLIKAYPVKFFFYDDTRKKRGYIASIGANLFKQHFHRFPYLEDEPIFYHDCDMIFTKPFNMIDYTYNDMWYGSNVEGYIGHDYIISKGEDVLDLMCKIVDIDKDLVKENQKNTIGAQHLLKGVNEEFWHKVEIDGENLYNHVTALNNQKSKEIENYHPVQIWTASMWSLLWNGWRAGFKTKNLKEFDFTWATCPIEKWDKNSIFHNAGVTCACGGKFYKAQYISEFPYNKNLNINNKYASYNYWQQIKKTAKSSVLLN